MHGFLRRDLRGLLQVWREMMEEYIKLSHGAGGRMTSRLVEELFAKAFSMDELDDSAEIAAPGERLAFTIDSFVVKPIFFPGGDIGKLSVCGTVNDLCAKGAAPGYMSVSFVIEEGLETSTLERIVDSISSAAGEAGVRIVAGDTKVVEKGSADKLYITTCGIGRIPENARVSARNARPGDAVIVSGPIGDHGIAVMRARGDLVLEMDLESDCAPLNDLVRAVLESGIDVHAMRDPTRGGLATVLVEIARASGIDIVIKEKDIPVRREVKAACELLGLDPMYVANEGKMVFFVPGEQAEAFLEVAKGTDRGREAMIIGTAEEGTGKVTMETRVGGMRPVIMLEGDPLPRIC